jgi:hypothetical protein
MKRYVTLTVCLFFFFGGIAKALGDCFERGDHDLSRGHHFAARNETDYGAARHHVDEELRVHCWERDFDTALASLASTSDTKRLLKEDRFYKNLAGTAHQTPSDVIAYVAPRGGGFPLSLFQTSLSPHLFLSVLRI